jgi:hypothetical protein
VLDVALQHCIRAHRHRRGGDALPAQLAGPTALGEATDGTFRVLTQERGADDMRVAIKSFEVEMDVKTNGIEFEVYDNDDNFLGDCFLTKTGLTWCEGKTRRKNGVKVSWREFIDWMNSDQ